MHSVNDPLGSAYSSLTVTFKAPAVWHRKWWQTQAKTPSPGCCGWNRMVLSQLACCFQASSSQNKPMWICGHVPSVCTSWVNRGCGTSTTKPNPKCRCLFSKKSKGYTLFSWRAEMQRPQVILLTIVRSATAAHILCEGNTLLLLRSNQGKRSGAHSKAQGFHWELGEFLTQSSTQSTPTCYTKSRNKTKKHFSLLETGLSVREEPWRTQSRLQKFHLSSLKNGSGKLVMVESQYVGGRGRRIANSLPARTAWEDYFREKMNLRNADCYFWAGPTTHATFISSLDTWKWLQSCWHMAKIKVDWTM